MTKLNNSGGLTPSAEDDGEQEKLDPTLYALYRNNIMYSKYLETIYLPTCMHSHASSLKISPQITVPYCTALTLTVFYFVALNCTVLYFTSLYWTALIWFSQYFNSLYYNVLDIKGHYIFVCPPQDVELLYCFPNILKVTSITIGACVKLSGLGYLKEKITYVCCCKLNYIYIFFLYNVAIFFGLKFQEIQAIIFLGSI